MYIREIINMCDPLDIGFSIRYIFPQAQIYTSAADTRKYKIHVLSVRDNVDYLGYLSDEIRVASGNIHHIRLNEYTCQLAAKYGHYHVLKYAHENGCSWDSWTCLDAAVHGHLGCLKYAHENGCDWDGLVCYDAAIHGHLDCLKYAYENGCSLDASIYSVAMDRNHLHIVKYLDDNNCPRI